MKTPVNIIAAIGKNRELGKNNKLLWHIPEDMKYFRRLTLGNIVIMGRKTFESLKNPLVKRINIVVTRKKNYKVPKEHSHYVLVAHSLKEALSKARKYKKEVFVIGGGEIYKQALKYADRLYLTLIDKTSSADTYFPKFSQDFTIISKNKSSYQSIKFTFVVLERKNKKQ